MKTEFKFKAVQFSFTSILEGKGFADLSYDFFVRLGNREQVTFAHRSVLKKYCKIDWLEITN